MDLKKPKYQHQPRLEGHILLWHKLPGDSQRSPMESLAPVTSTKWETKSQGLGRKEIGNEV